MKISRMIVACFATLLFVAPAFAGDKAQVPDATITLSAKTFATGIGRTSGEGVLTYKGQKIPFKLSGFSLGELGISVLDATGDVYNLTFLEKFDGVYDTQNIEGALIIGAGKTAMKNDSGVQISLSTKQKGLKIGASLGGSRMTMDPDALAKALAALNPPKVKAVYHTSVYFKTGSSKINESQDTALNQVITLLKKKPGTEVILAGYADTTGSEKGNMVLSAKRAGAVFEKLKRRATGTIISSLPPQRIDIIGAGQVDGPQGVSEQKDRRVDILIIETTPTKG